MKRIFATGLFFLMVVSTANAIPQIGVGGYFTSGFPIGQLKIDSLDMTDGYELKPSYTGALVSFFYAGWPIYPELSIGYHNGLQNDACTIRWPNHSVNIPADYLSLQLYLFNIGGRYNIDISPSLRTYVDGGMTICLSKIEYLTGSMSGWYENSTPYGVYGGGGIIWFLTNGPPKVGIGGVFRLNYLGNSDYDYYDSNDNSQNRTYSYHHPLIITVGVGLESYI